MDMSWKICLALLIALTSSYDALGAKSEDIGDDYTLGIYGNANMDDSIDEMDIAYVGGVINGTYAATNYSDANYDGQIDAKDIDQIRDIISGTEKELIIVDSCYTQQDPILDKRTVTIHRPVERIIPLLIHGAKALKIAGAGDKIVGAPTDIVDYDYYWPELIDKPQVGTWQTPDYEAIAKLQPDLVISHISHASEIGEKLKSFGIPVVGLDFHKDHTLKSELKKLGYILDNEAQASIEEYLDWRKKYEDIINEAVDKLTEKEKPRVFIMWSWKHSASEISTFGPSASGHLPCINAGGINIAAELGPSYPKVDSEWILKENPDIIIIQLSPSSYSGVKWGWNNTEELNGVITDAIRTCGWDNLTAVKNGKVYIYSSEIAVGPESIVRLAYWAKWLHPDKFMDLDPEEIQREYLERFMKISYPEDTVFVYKKES
jgi:iron complex transport system substrate-binding protein